MRPMIIALFVATAAALVAAAQTIRPGQMTEARVWVQNRGRSEALPVDIREVNTDHPFKVEVVNGEPLSPRPVSVVMARPSWEYKTMVINDAAQAVRLLNAEGQAGWETTGVSLVNPDGTTVILKRLR
jgi:hypothetical protein